ncbi:MAG: M48 family metalloprotease [Thermoplasmata archaeon]|nr:M48 family metalloprotease [Thermoplasmata archaeon]
MRKLGLYARLTLAIALLFAIIYGLLVLIAYFMGYAQPIVLAVLAALIIILQYVMSPKIVEMAMRVRYIKKEDMPRLYSMVEKLAKEANIPMPKVGIAEIELPNAFAFGRSVRDGRVCVTRGLLKILNDEELEAVLGHEISHLKHRDMAIITMLSVIPLICYLAFWSLLWGRRRDSSSALAFLAFIIYFITNLIVLYVSRIREYYADYGSVMLTKKPHALASALYRITTATASIHPSKIKKVEGMRAFFATDPARTRKGLFDLRQADLNMDGHIDENELQYVAQHAKTTATDKLMELFSSHPNVVERIKRLAELR